MSSITVKALKGRALEAALPDVARLRIAVFREWPYLYDGDVAYERRYLAGYSDTPEAVIAVALVGDRVIGASTGMPLSAHGDASSISLPAGVPPTEQIYYCAESVLLPDYRGQGLGHRFFDIREEVAVDAGFKLSIFASVIRPSDHPLRPDSYRPLDGFWRKRGYAPVEGAALSIAWKDIDQPQETQKSFRIWARVL
ncbi:MAG: GNAT family N-acetyltransferase [Pseudomonadota bacterium]